MNQRMTAVYFLLGGIYIVLNLLELKIPALLIKAIPIWLLVFLVWQNRHMHDAVRSWMMLALGAGSVGDILLSLPVDWNFIPGLGAFLIGHICYILAFLPLRKPSGTGLLGAALIVGFALTVAVLLQPLPEGLVLPIFLYIMVIAIMGVTASLKGGSQLAIAGAFLFVLSDSLIAINKFAVPIPYSVIFVMATYYPAQYLLVRSVLVDFPDRGKA